MRRLSIALALLVFGCFDPVPEADHVEAFPAPAEEPTLKVQCCCLDPNNSTNVCCQVQETCGEGATIPGCACAPGSVTFSKGVQRGG